MTGLAVLIGGRAAPLSREPAGRIEQLQGRVTLSRGKIRLAAAVGRKLYAGDCVTTGRNAQAILRLGAHRVKMGPETSMLVRETELKEGRYRLRLDLGQLWLLIQKGLPRLDFNVETPAAVAGVRGTFFTVQVQPDGTTWVGVREGLVRVESADGAGTVDLSPGYGTMVKPGGKPAAPKKTVPGQVGGDDLAGKGKEKGKPDGGDRRGERNQYMDGVDEL